MYPVLKQADMRNGRIMEIEARLEALGLARKQETTLSALCEEISNRIAALGRLRNELEDIGRQMYYYDVVDYLSEVPVKRLGLPECAAMLKELSIAEQKFVEDGSNEYLAACAQLRNSVIKAGMSLCKGIFEEETTDHCTVSDFYTHCSDEEGLRVKREYTQSRIKSLGKKIDACIANPEKTYRIFLVGEIRRYATIFDGPGLESYSRKRFMSRDRPVDPLDEYLQEIHTAVSKSVDSDRLLGLFAPRTDKQKERNIADMALQNLAIYSFGIPVQGTSTRYPSDILDL